MSNVENKSKKNSKN